MLLPPEIVPLTDAAVQTVNVILGGQSCRINIYTKSLNVPIEDPGTIPASPVEMASFTGSIAANVLTAAGAVTGTILPGNFLDGAGMTTRTYVVEQLTGSEGGAGTYSVTPTYASPLGPIPMTSSSPPLPTYENINPVFIDLYVDENLIVGGVLCYNWSLIVMNTYLGFVGDLAMIDTQDNEDPMGVPLTLPPPDLRNWWQRELPLSLGGKMSPSVANRIPGLGSRFLLTYWPNLR